VSGVTPGKRFSADAGGDTVGIEDPEIDPERSPTDAGMRVGEITSDEPFPEAREDLYKLCVDFGTECLVTGVDDADGGVVHLRPDRQVPSGEGCTRPRSSRGRKRDA
jgi:tRNA-binding EMAP/Myf-like protein